MDEYQALSHNTWDCKYHVVFIRKCRRRTLCLQLRRHLGEVFHKLAPQKGSKILEAHLMPDHVHMTISILPKYPVSQVVGFINGKIVIQLARVCGERKRNFVVQLFWAREYFVNTVGRDEEAIRAHKGWPRGARRNLQWGNHACAPDVIPWAASSSRH